MQLSCDDNVCDYEDECGNDDQNDYRDDYDDNGSDIGITRPRPLAKLKEQVTIKGGGMNLKILLITGPGPRTGCLFAQHERRFERVGVGQYPGD